MGKLKIPEGATAVRVETTEARSYALVFDTPDGEVEIVVGSDMERAVKLMARVSRVLRTREE